MNYGFEGLASALMALFVLACVGAVALLVGGGFGLFWLAHHVHIT